MRILITSTYYAPEPCGNAPYVAGAAEYLASVGHEVTVLAGVPHYPGWRVAPPPWEMREERNGVTLVRRRHYVPRTQGAAKRAAYELSLYLGSALTRTRTRPDVIIGVIPSLASGVLAHALSRRLRAPYALLFQDLMGRGAAQSGVSGGRRVASLVRAVECRVARGASMIGIVAQGFRDYLEEEGISSDRIMRLRNWARWTQPTWDPEETRARFRLHRPFVLHAGNMGSKQGLGNVLRAAQVLADANITVVLAGDGNRREWLESQVRDMQLPNVAFVDPQPPGPYESLLSAAEVLLLNQGREVVDMSLPSKLTSYFAAGRPIIAAVSPKSEAAQEVSNARAGIIVEPDNPRALAEAVVDLVHEPGLRERLGGSGRAYAHSELLAERALPRYEDLVHATVAR